LVSSNIMLQRSYVMFNRAYRRAFVRSFCSKTESFERVPVTIMSGWLGSGKTTLLNRILSSSHGKKIAVIQNELGESPIDADLVAEVIKSENMMVMNNGCVCCTFRSDIVPLVGKLLTNDKYDHIVLEATGIAKMGPLLQAFLRDPLSQYTTIDSCVVMVDAVNYEEVVKEDDARQQIAFADRAFITKLDLVTEKTSRLAELEQRIGEINPYAKIGVCEHGETDIEQVLSIKAFDSVRVEADLISLEEGSKENQPHEHQEHNNNNNSISAVSLVCKTGALLGMTKLSNFMYSLVHVNHGRLMRLKGILALQDQERRLIVQSVGSAYKGEYGSAWKEKEQRESRLVVIGRGLKAEELREGFANCFEDSGDKNTVEAIVSGGGHRH